MNVITDLIKFIYIKVRNKGKLEFSFSSKISNNSVFEGMNKVHPKAHFNGFLGFGSYVGPNSDIIGKVGRFTSIAPNVSINPGVHPFKAPYVTTSPAFFSLRKQNGATFVHQQFFDEIKYADSNKKYVVDIGNDCWIGQNVFIAGGVNIGNGAVVLAGAVVTKDLPPYSISGGVPAKVIDYRYNEDIIQTLMQFKWWDKEISWLKENHHLLRNIDALIEYINEKK